MWKEKKNEENLRKRQEFICNVVMERWNVVQMEGVLYNNWQKKNEPASNIAFV